MKLTEKAVASFKSGGKTDHIEFDENFPGFGIRLRGAGKTWIYQYAFGSGVKRVNARMTLGKWPALPAAKARSIAEDLHAKVRLGGHPAADKKVSRSEAGFTFGKLIDGYLEFKKGELRPKSYVEVARHLNVYAAPLHGLPVAAIDLRRIGDLLDGVAKERGTISANRTQTTLGTLFTWAMRKGLAAANPVIAAEKRRERSRDRVLSDRELATVWNTVPEGDYGDIIRLLILTRRSGGRNWLAPVERNRPRTWPDSRSVGSASRTAGPLKSRCRSRCARFSNGGRNRRLRLSSLAAQDAPAFPVGASQRSGRQSDCREARQGTWSHGLCMTCAERLPPGWPILVCCRTSLKRS